MEELEGTIGRTAKVSTGGTLRRTNPTAGEGLQTSSGLGRPGIGEASHGHLEEIVTKGGRPRAASGRGRQDPAVRILRGHGQQHLESSALSPAGDLTERLRSQKDGSIFLGHRQISGRMLEKGQQSVGRSRVSEITQIRHDVVSAGETRLAQESQEHRQAPGSDSRLGDLFRNTVKVGLQSLLTHPLLQSPRQDRREWQDG
jgi:hypothetical protein